MRYLIVRYLYHPNIVSQIPLVNSIPKVKVTGPTLEKSVFVEKGGDLRSGNYYLYIRYATESFNKTHFLTEIGPIQIGSGDHNDIYSVEGIQGESGDSGRENLSDKRVRVILENLDRNHEAFEHLSKIHKNHYK